MTDYVGFDYSLGQSNRDKETGIHFGVISQNEVLQAWADSSEPYYGEPHCPKCGNKAITYDAEYPCDCGKNDCNCADCIDEYERLYHACNDYRCDHCKVVFDLSCIECEPISFYVDDAEYSAECGEDGDIFIMKSPYYTHSQYCSPCAPGAGYLMNPCEDGPRTYCFGHAWFESGIAPYPVFKVSDDSPVLKGE